MIDPKTSKKVLIYVQDEYNESDNEAYGSPIIPDEEAKISDFFTLENKKAYYEYDFGDFWGHKIVLEKILPVDPKVKYPRCIAGKRACPPEDCGSY